MVDWKNDEEALNVLRDRARERTVKAQSIEYDLNTLINRIDNGSIRIDPDYQRRHRWDDSTSSRLIESLLLNIPIPTIYLSQDIDLDEESDGQATYTVIDGQQRLTAMKNFFHNDLKLTGLDALSDLNGCIYSDLPRFLVRRLEDRTIGCLRIDSTVDSKVKYDIFERLNSGSVELSPQELRNATYRGKFNEMIIELAENETFRALTNMSESRIKKMEDVELVLRFFALTDGRYREYKPLMRTYLDNSMSEFAKVDMNELEGMRSRFLERMEYIAEAFGPDPFAKWKFKESGQASKFNTAVFDAVVVSLDNILSAKASICENPSGILRNMFNNEEFADFVASNTNDGTKLRGRIELLEVALRDDE